MTFSSVCRRLVSLALAAAVCLSVLPGAVFASGESELAEMIPWDLIREKLEASQPEEPEETVTEDQRQAELEDVLSYLPRPRPVTFSPDGGQLEEGGITLSCETQDAAIYYAVSADGETYGDYQIYAEPITPEPGFGTMYIKAFSAKTGTIPSQEQIRCFTEKPQPDEGRVEENTDINWRLYFGQLHAHSSISDGAVPVQQVFELAAMVPGMDFLAVTDHSHSLDGAEEAAIAKNGALISDDWAAGKSAAAAVTNSSFVGIYGYEMSWPAEMDIGHISTFNTPGFQSWQQEPYRTYDGALENYYDALASVPGSVSQFNHPGMPYGNFAAFDHYFKEADKVITLLEVSGGEDDALLESEYIRALDKGWHVAPTCSQTDLRSNWGAGKGRTVIQADSLTETDLYKAMADYRVYATQDNDLHLLYTLSGHAMGSRLERKQIGSTASVRLGFWDPTDQSLGKVEVITRGGTILWTKTVTENRGVLDVNLPAGNDYYYLRITQADGDVALTAPVWIRQELDAGIRDLTCDTAVPEQGKQVEITLELYNNSNADLAVEQITFTANGESIHTVEESFTVAAGGTETYRFFYTHSGLGHTQIAANVTGTLQGTPRQYEKTLTLTYKRPDMVTGILVDGTHGNAGLDSLQNMTALAAENNVTVSVERQQITKELLDKNSILIITAPAVELEEDFLALAADFAASGGSVILCGQTDRKDGALHTAAQLNRLLSRLGSTMTFRDDTAQDTVNSGDETDDLYPAECNTLSKWCGGVTEDQVYSHRSGSTVDPGSGTWLVKGYATTRSVDEDGDGGASGALDSPVLLAWEEAGGSIFAAGSLFLEDQGMEAPKNVWDAPYANRTIFETILGAYKSTREVTSIADVRAGTRGQVYRIRGYVTAGTSNPYTTFPETVYLQDDTGGIAIVPFTAPDISLGVPLDVEGYLDMQDGNPVLQLITWSALNERSYNFEPRFLPLNKAMDLSLCGGQLIQVEGRVAWTTYNDDGTVSRFRIRDDDGNRAEVFIEDTILSGSTGKNELDTIVKWNKKIRAIGIAYRHPDGTTVVRVRNCDEVVAVSPLPYDPSNPQSGDRIMVPVTLMLGSLAALLVLLVIHKRKKK